MILFAVSVICVARLGLADKLVLPVTICKRDSSEYSTCLLHAIQEAWPRFLSGLPEFDFPSLEPLVHKYGKGEFNTSEIHAEIRMKDITIKGLKNCRFTGVRAHLADDVFRLEIDVMVPRIYVRGYGVGEGRLGPFRLNGKGILNMTAHDVRGTWDFTGHVSNDTWTVERFRVYPSIEKFKIFFDDIFDVKELNDLAVDFINEYWPALYRGILPILADIWESWLRDLANQLFTKVSFSALFP